MFGVHPNIRKVKAGKGHTLRVYEYITKEDNTPFEVNFKGKLFESSTNFIKRYADYKAFMYWRWNLGRTDPYPFKLPDGSMV